MGELVTGIGDEVILFSALVVLSMLIIVLWSRVRRVQSHGESQHRVNNQLEFISFLLPS